MSDKRRLIYAFVQFLNREMEGEEHSEDAKESMEVASQCLQTAFAMNAGEDKHLAVSKDLVTIFAEATSLKDEAEAEKFKEEGSNAMEAQDFQKAVELFTKVGRKWPGLQNARVFCNVKDISLSLHCEFEFLYR